MPFVCACNEITPALKRVSSFTTYPRGKLILSVKHDKSARFSVGTSNPHLPRYG